MWKTIKGHGNRLQLHETDNHTIEKLTILTHFFHENNKIFL